jgi:uncharacterized membrane protein
MVFTIVIGIVLLALILGFFQKKEEQKSFREYSTSQGGFRSFFPVLVNMLEKDLEMALLTDSGDAFLYQKEIKISEAVLGYFRIGRKLDYSRNNILYTEFLTNGGDIVSGMQIGLEGEVHVEAYKTLIKKSYSELLQERVIVKSNTFFNYFSDNSIDEKKEEAEILPYPIDSSDSYYKFWHSFPELKPELSGQRIKCTVINKHSWELPFNDDDDDDYDEDSELDEKPQKVYHFIQLGLIKDRNLQRCDGLYKNFAFHPTVEKKIEWHKRQMGRLLESIESSKLTNGVKYEDILEGDSISFDVKYNPPPTFELSAGPFQLSWKELERQEYIVNIEEYEFSNFSVSRTLLSRKYQ